MHENKVLTYIKKGETGTNEKEKNHRTRVNEVVYWFTNRWKKHAMAKTSH